MSTYIMRRVLTNVPVLFGITAVIFLLMELMPGDPLMSMLAPAVGVHALPEGYIENLRHELGLDKPLPIRYLIWLGQVVQGNLGTSVTTTRPVMQEILFRLPATLELMIASTCLSVIVGVPLGIYSAVKQYSFLDYLLMTLSFVWICIPAFFFALIMIYIFSLHLGWLPAGGFRTAGVDKFSLGDNLKHLAMPAVVLAMGSLAEYLRFTRAAMLDVLHSEYIVTARAKGLSYRVVILVHALRNALIPVVTRIGLSLAWLFSGALIVETVFRWPGLGVLMMQGVMTRDYPLILGQTLFIAVTVLAANLITDVTYGLIDPRIRYR